MLLLGFGMKRYQKFIDVGGEKDGKLGSKKEENALRRK
jgi:hypothetical protein